MRSGLRLGIIASVFMFVVAVFSFGFTQEPDVNALSAVLMDAQTGEVLFAKNPNLRRPPASTTKIVTATLAIESGNLDRIVTVSKNAATKEGSTCWLRPGEKKPLRELIYGLMLSSGNDAATAIAEDIAGSESDFARKMTEKAHQLGAVNSNFANASGLPAAGHYTTAYDLALITCYALKNPDFSQVVQTKEYLMPGDDLQKEQHLYNHNRLLWRYAYADGVKTGYTQNAGRCLVSSASKDGRRLVAVVFRSKTMYKDSQALLDYGFDHFRMVSLGNQGFHESVPVKVGVEASVDVVPQREIKTVVPAQDFSKVRVETVLKNEVEAPVARMQPLGEVKLFMGDTMIDKVPLLAASDVPRETFFLRIVGWFKRLFGFDSEGNDD